MWDTITPSGRAIGSSAWATAKKGARSICRSFSNVRCTVEISSSSERSEAPRPGKWVATTATRPSAPSWTPRMYACPICPTQNGSPPNARTPRSPAPSGDELSRTSKDGPSSILTPRARSSCPTIWPTASAWVGFQVAPTAIWEGSGVIPLTTLVNGMELPSWLTATKSGTKGPGGTRSSTSVSVTGCVAAHATSWSCPTSVATCAGVSPSLTTLPFSGRSTTPPTW